MRNKKHPKFKQKQSEVILYYDLARDVKVRPYIYFFPYEQNPFKQNAVDVKMKSIWTQHQTQLKKEQDRKNSLSKGKGSHSQSQRFNVSM